MRTSIIFTGIFFALFIIKTHTTQAQCLKSDSLELIKLYNATNGANWRDKWDLSKPVGMWYGITLTDDGCHVKEIDLHHKYLSGYIPELNLPYLEELDLNDNKLNGGIPNFDLPKLEILDLSYNMLDGYIPSFDLPNLKKLYLNDNQLSRDIPNFNCPELLYLYLYNNRLSGAIPDFNFPKLLYLFLENNQLSGHIPNFDLPSLEKLYLGDNRLSGPIQVFDKLFNLDYLYLSNNQLSGSIPNFEKLTKLKYLLLDENQLSGDVPKFDLPNLKWLQLDHNRLNSIPLFNEMPKLEGIYLSHNQLSGAVPNFDLPNLKWLELDHNQLSSIPLFNEMPKLKEIYLSHNQLSEAVPNFDLPNMKRLELDHNQLSSIPLFNEMPKLEEIYLSHNQLSEAVPKFDLPNLTKLDLSHNRLSGAMPDFKNFLPSRFHIECLSKNFFFRNCSVLNLSYNAFTFEGIEQNLNIYDFYYENQDTIPIYKNEKNSLYVKAGGDIKKNSYTWYRDGRKYETIVGDSLFVPTESGTYYCEVRNCVITRKPKYCTYPPYYPCRIKHSQQNLILHSDEILVQIESNGYTQEGLENKQPNNIILYPNPAKENVSISIENVEEKQVNIEVLDRFGGLHMKYSAKQSTNETIKLNTRSLSDGYYYVRIQVDGKQVVVKPLIIAH